MAIRVSRSGSGAYALPTGHGIFAALMAIMLVLPMAACGDEADGRLTLEASSYCDELCCEEEEERICYGPCCCQPRGTLLQWSYGTSFSGGPDLDEPLVTDRPDFTESAVTVGRGVIQLEAGYTYEYDNEGTESTKAHVYPQMLVRAGVFAEWLELRLGWNYLEESTISDNERSRVSGSDDILVGFKIALTPQECLLPEMGVLVQMTVPSGTTGVSAGEVLPGVNWVYAWEVNDFLSVAGSTQAFRSQDDTGDYFVTVAQSMTAGYGLTDNLGAFTEWYVLIPSGADTAETEHYFDGGFTYLISNDLQLDVSAGVGLTSAATDYFVGSGFSARF